MTTKSDIETLYFDQQLTRQVIASQLGLSVPTVATYVNQLIADRKARGLSIPMRKRSGGFVSLADQPLINKSHRVLGSKIQYHREFVARQDPQTFATRVGITHTYLRRIEMGVTSPTLLDLTKIADTMGCSVTSMLEGICS